MASPFLPELAPAEHDRLASFQICEILDTAPSPDWQRFARLAARLLGVPSAMVALVGLDGVGGAPLVKATVGLRIGDARQGEYFISQAVQRPDCPLTVGDASVDRRFAGDPLVSGPDAVRFCAMAPLVNVEGRGIGMLCAFDRTPHALTDSDMEYLTDLANGLSEAIYLRHSVVQLCEAALHDKVTGFPNRTLLEYRLDGAIARAKRADGLALLCINIDRLQSVNDMFGHAGGDTLLREVGRRIAVVAQNATGGRVIGGDTMISRTGAGEFAVLLPESAGAQDVAQVADQLLAALAAPVTISGQPITVQVAVGFAVHPDDGDHPAVLFQRAQATLDDAKRHHATGAKRFEPGIERDTVQRHELERDLRQALDTDAFYLHWQPIADALSQQPIGHEALLRWDRPGHGPVPPGEFIAAAEACGLSGPLDAWVLRRACHEAAQWPDTSLRAAVNVSANRVRFGDLSDAVASALESSGLAPARLEIEITERVLMEDETAVRGALEALRALGVRIALDDFGTGFSSIGLLRTLPLDKLKLDRSFTRDLVTDPHAREVARTVVRLGRVLGLIVLAEGVETEDQLSCLKVMGCDEVQGYLLGWPRPIVSEPDASARPRSMLRAAMAG